MASATTPTAIRQSWTETAYDWYQRSKRESSLQEIPQDPTAAAWAFWRRTGISFVDTALRRRLPAALPVLHVRSSDPSISSWMVVSLAARFVTATRASKFDDTAAVNSDSNRPPRVVLFDSTLDVTPVQLGYAVRSTLLRVEDDDRRFEQDMKECLSRIHVAATTTHLADWVPMLEALRLDLDPAPTVLLWDGFLQEPGEEGETAEVIRQLGRLVEEERLVIVTCTTGRSHVDWDKYITHRIQLDQKAEGGHDYVATVQGTQIPFSVTLSGVLS